MSYTVYILYSHKDGNLYTGCTKNLEDRLKRHASGQVKATKHRRPVACIHSEEYEDKAEAFNRERFLKSLWGGRFKRTLKKEYLEKLNN